MVIPYSRQRIDAADVEAVDAVLAGDWLTQGPSVAAFEEAIAARCDVPHAIAFSSGTAALHAAALALGAGPGDELLTSGLTFAGSANCGAYAGATPTFADVEADTWNVSARTMLAAATERTRVAVPVHFTGLPAPVAEIRAALDPGVRILEDAAQALGSRTAEGPVGACLHSDVSVFSFHPTKAVTTAEGGIATTRDPELAGRLRELRHHGMVAEPARLAHLHDAGFEQGPWYHEQQSLGFNYRLSDVHAALGLSQLDKLDGFIADRARVAARYREALGDVAGLTLPPEPGPGEVTGRHLFVILLPGPAERLELYERLRARDVRTQVHYIPVYWHPYYRDTFGYRPGLCPNVEDYYSRCLSIPCFPGLTEADQDVVVGEIRSLMGAA